MAKITGWKVWAVTRDLAEGRSQTSIAAMYGVTQQAISLFADAHKDEIEATRAQLSEAYVGLWAAEKAKRIAAYQQDLDDLDAQRAHTNILTGEDRRVRHAALRAIADELGDLPQRIRIEGGKDPVRHVIEGVDVDKLS